MAYPPHELGSGESFPAGFNTTLILEAYQHRSHELDHQIGSIVSAGIPYELAIEDPDQLLVLSSAEHASIWGLFPDGARERAIPASISSSRPKWVSGLSGNRPEYTVDPLLAFSNDAFILGQTSFRNVGSPHERTAHVTLFQIPETIEVERHVQRIAEAKAVVHAHAHRIIQPDLADRNTTLVLPDGISVDSLDFLIEFFATVSKYYPISHLSSAYQKAKYVDHQELSRAMSEELAETIAAYLLGFTVDPQTELLPPEVNVTPFMGREDVRFLVHDYLHARRVEK